jgi:hypothetical protein
MTIQLTSDRYALVAAGKNWALFWPRRAWAAMPYDERLALILDQHLLFDVDRRAAHLTEQCPAPLSSGKALSGRDRQPTAPAPEQRLPDDD